MWLEQETASVLYLRKNVQRS